MTRKRRPISSWLILFALIALVGGSVLFVMCGGKP